MLSLLSRLLRRPRFTVAARGELGTPFPAYWFAVPSLEAGAFKDAYPLAGNGLDAYRAFRVVAGKRSDLAAEMDRLAALLRSLEDRYPHCVLFVLIPNQPR